MDQLARFKMALEAIINAADSNSTKHLDTVFLCKSIAQTALKKEYK